MWAPTISSDELYHHGILKMKWGVRNGPPYPLKPSDHSAAEKRAMNLGENANKKEHKGLSDEQKETAKKIAKGAAITAGTIVAAYASYKVMTDPRFRRMARKGMDLVKGANRPKEIERLLKSSAPEIVNKKTGQKFTGDISDLITRNGEKFIDKSTADTITKKVSSNNISQIPTGIDRTIHQVTKEIKNTAPKLEFGTSSPARNTDMERLLANNRRLQMLANGTMDAAKKSTGNSKYAKDLLKKNAGRFANMTMKDLKDLDLY